MVYLKQCRYCVVNMVQRSGALDVVELGYTIVLLGVAISSRHLSVFVSFLFLLVQWGSTRQSRYVGEGSYLLASRMIGSKVLRNLTQNIWFQSTENCTGELSIVSSTGVEEKYFILVKIVFSSLLCDAEEHTICWCNKSELGRESNSFEHCNWSEVVQVFPLTLFLSFLFKAKKDACMQFCLNLSF
jgi:hypothetical protein